MPPTDTEPVTMTPTELTAHTAEAVKAALGQAGIDATAITAAKTENDRVAGQNQADAKVIRDRREADEDKAARASDDPHAIDNLLAARKQERAAEELVTGQRALADAQAALAATQEAGKKGDAVALAAELHVDQGLLERFGGGTDEGMRALAKSLPAVGGNKAGDRDPDPGSSDGGDAGEAEKMKAYIQHPEIAANVEGVGDTLKRLGLTN